MKASQNHIRFNVHLHRGNILLPAATKLGQGNIFRSVCQEFCARGGGYLVWSRGVYLADPPPRIRYTAPLRPGTPPPPQTRYTPPRPGTPPGPGPPPQIRTTSGRYASYWNAFLFIFVVAQSVNIKLDSLWTMWRRCRFLPQYERTLIVEGNMLQSYDVAFVNKFAWTL